MMTETPSSLDVPGSTGRPPAEKASTQRVRWMKQWVPQETVLNNGKCFLHKWITEGDMNVLQSGSTLEAVEAKLAKIAKGGLGEVYVCVYEGCGKVFYDPSALRKHSHTHGEKQFVCHYEGCGKRFVDSSKLKRHFLIHTGEKHFVCPFDGCGKAFSLDFNLRSHMRTHTLENYHTCPYEECGKRYAHEYKLRAHIKAHHDQDLVLTPPQTEQEEQMIRDELGEREGEGEGTARPPEEQQQQQQRLAPAKREKEDMDDEGERPFVCPHLGCGKRYIHEYKLNLHLRKEHTDEQDGGGEGGTGLQKVRGKGKEKELGKRKAMTDPKRGKEGRMSEDGRERVAKIRYSDEGPGSTENMWRREMEVEDMVNQQEMLHPGKRHDWMQATNPAEDSEETEREDSEETEPEYGVEAEYEADEMYGFDGAYAPNVGYGISGTYVDDGTSGRYVAPKDYMSVGAVDVDDDATDDELEGMH